MCWDTFQPYVWASRPNPHILGSTSVSQNPEITYRLQARVKMPKVKTPKSYWKGWMKKLKCWWRTLIRSASWLLCIHSWPTTPEFLSFTASLWVSTVFGGRVSYPRWSSVRPVGQFDLHWYQQCQFKSSHSVILCWTRQEEQTFYNIVFSVMIKRRYQGKIPRDFSISFVIFLLFKFPSQFSSHPFALS